MQSHADHELIRATATLHRRGLVEFVLCLDCRTIVSEHPPSPIAAPTTPWNRARPTVPAEPGVPTPHQETHRV